MKTLKMAKTPKNSDKLRLIKQEEEAFEDQQSKYETNSCGRRCKVLLSCGILIGMLIVLCYLILLGWQLYMEQLGSNETAPIFAIHGIPLLQKYLTDDMNEVPLGSRKVYENIYERKKRSQPKANGLQSEKDNFYKKENNILHEEKTGLHKENLLEDSSDFGDILEKIIENEQMGSKSIENSFENNQETKQVIDIQKITDHQIFEDEDKLIMNETGLHKEKLKENTSGLEEVLEKIIETEQIGSKSEENSYISNQETKQAIDMKKIKDRQISSDLDSNLRSTIRKNMNRIYHITGKNKNLALGIYCSITLVCGILLTIVFGLCIRFLYKFIIIKMVNKHKRLKEEQQIEINKRLDPLYYVSPFTPGTPIDKDLRYTIQREKIDMFCDIYD